MLYVCKYILLIVDFKTTYYNYCRFTCNFFAVYILLFCCILTKLQTLLYGLYCECYYNLLLLWKLSEIINDDDKISFWK